MTALGHAGRGDEWIVEAFGCDAGRLADRAVLATLLDRMVHDLALRQIGAGQWHVFPPPGGVTGMLLLAESHLTVHTFPEHGSLCLNLFCCTPRPAWPFAARLADVLGAERVEVRHVDRIYVAGVAAAYS
ncbi:MAG TPA: S-adenosylmethionine decarboxylase [Gemmatimonadaceae bacterium]|nr:S-adenosylmethionine decarboxylase [Gemmatimonadaceae bacterium]